MFHKIINPLFENFNILFRSLSVLAKFQTSAKDIWKQCYEFGNRTFGIVALCVTFMGVILITEYSFHMKLVIGNDSMIPAFAMIMLARELAPIVTALLITSKMGASIAAELAAMKNSEQIDAYRLLGLNIVDLYVAPRLIASVFANVCLTVVALAITVIGAWASAVYFLNFSTGPFFHSLVVFLSPFDFILMVTKSASFAIVIPIISAYCGLEAKHGAEGVGEATTNAVVGNSITIIIIDFIITFLFSKFY
ncbi:ABC transporter permease [bacterium]|nr:ABC transporter permease [bacterium]